jgi:hypothetical protein
MRLLTAANHWSVKELSANLRRRDHTLIFFSEQPVAMFRKELVKEIPAKTRDDYAGVKKRPKSAENSGDPQCGGRINVSSFIVDQNDRIRFAQVELFAITASGFRLKRGKPKTVVTIVPNNKVYGTVTKITDPVKQNDPVHHAMLNRLRKIVNPGIAI